MFLFIIEKNKRRTEVYFYAIMEAVDADDGGREGGRVGYEEKEVVLDGVEGRRGRFSTI